MTWTKRKGIAAVLGGLIALGGAWVSPPASGRPQEDPAKPKLEAPVGAPK